MIRIRRTNENYVRYWSVEGTILGTLFLVGVLLIGFLVGLAIVLLVQIGWWGALIVGGLFALVGMGALIGYWESGL